MLAQNDRRCLLGLKMATVKAAIWHTGGATKTRVNSISPLVRNSNIYIYVHIINHRGNLANPVVAIGSFAHDREAAMLASARARKAAGSAAIAAGSGHSGARVKLAAGAAAATAAWEAAWEAAWATWEHAVQQ